MGSAALKNHEKSEKHKKKVASVNDRQIKITNVFVSTSNLNQPQYPQHLSRMMHVQSPHH